MATSFVYIEGHIPKVLAILFLSIEMVGSIALMQYESVVLKR